MIVPRTFVFLVIVYFKEICGLKNVVLDIEPRIVEYGKESKLRCSYDLEQEPLYTVKWYRGQFEFYRFTPKENPNTQIFSIEGLDVDKSRSNEHQVVLRNIGFNLSGNFSCEVTTDEPFFASITVIKDMLVVVLPKSPPSLTTDKSFYEVGDVLRANCSSPQSRPAATLTFILNNIVVSTGNRFQSFYKLLQCVSGLGFRRVGNENDTFWRFTTTVRCFYVCHCYFSEPL